TVGYFTKWGDGAYDFNPIADLTVPEIYEILRYLGAPAHIIEKAPSAGLYQGQTDEAELGVTYSDIAAYVRGGELSESMRRRIAGMEERTAHKRRMPRCYPD
ncbi:MAG TPA: NAD(+) synthase, partial [Candidatus Limadaptatus stercorigallinarum]|nr:NAD(+) synthase [Candidatus Limadaptatus stercorigallinarum]